jgi:hypothetical protein
MDERSELLNYLMQAIGEEGCGVSCENAQIYWEDGGWNLLLEGFMEPWLLGSTVEEAKQRIKELASTGFGPAS